MDPPPHPARLCSPTSPRRGEVKRARREFVLGRDLAGELVLDMGANDVVEARLGPKAERDRALALEPLRPAANDARDGRIALAADAGGDLVAGDPSERRDLLADRAGHARHGEIDAVAERLAREPRRMHEKAHRRARARMGVAHA